MLTLKVLMLISVIMMSTAIAQMVKADIDMAELERQFTLLTSTTGLNVVALNASTVLLGALLTGGLFFLGGLALGALNEMDVFASGRRDEHGQDNDYENNAIDTLYMNNARRSLKALSPVFEMLMKAYSKYG